MVPLQKEQRRLNLSSRNCQLMMQPEAVLSAALSSLLLTLYTALLSHSHSTEQDHRVTSAIHFLSSVVLEKKDQEWNYPSLFKGPRADVSVANFASALLHHLYWETIGS